MMSTEDVGIETFVSFPISRCLNWAVLYLCVLHLLLVLEFWLP